MAEESENARRQDSWSAELKRYREGFRKRMLAHPVEGPWEELAYWDPLPTARAIAGSVAYGCSDTMGEGRWEDRSRLNVPGPFYAGVTDGGLNGPYYLPEHVLLSDLNQECVFRQPANVREVTALIEIAWGEPMGGYAWDGDQRWTPESVRDWWADRGFVRTWIAAELADEHSANEREALHTYAAYLDNGMERYLRGYLFWLIERTEPRLGELLPDL
nr:hypothetical protein GCM10010200_100040 [Actinomadura rugatobispora]